MSEISAERPRVFAVSEITGLIKAQLENSFRHVFVSGEVSNFKEASSGHWYFTLRDADAVLQCALFRGSRRGAQVMPRDGDLVEVGGSISVYPPRGSYQLIAQTLRPSGRGNILLLLEERKRKLAEEGLFERSRAIPVLPRTVVVVTSPTGAALRDILNVLGRRRERIIVRIVPVPVQGEGAGGRIAKAIAYASRYRLGDTMIVGRGGGSIEDLLPFSDEAVVRAIAAASMPVISAVGHETDWAISDYAADLRAPTPSAAAELASAIGSEIMEQIREQRTELVQQYRTRLGAFRHRLDHLTEDELRYRFRNFVQPWYQRLDDARSGIGEAIRNRFTAVSHRLELLTQRLAALSPYEPLERGYALVRRGETGSVVTTAAHTEPGEHLSVQFRDATIQVERITDG